MSIKFRPKPEIPRKLVGKRFCTADLQAVLDEIHRAEPCNRAEIARRVCRRLNWVDAIGRPQLMSARVRLLRLHRLGFIELPRARNGNGNGRGLNPQDVAWPAEKPLRTPVQTLTGLRLEPVARRVQSALWNRLVARYHYLGYAPMAGAQKRYLIEWDNGLLGAIGFGAAAWKLAARDRFIGWTSSTDRESHLHLILNNWRFLILPWVRSPNLASKILAMCARALPSDFEANYGYRPVLLESFVERGRYAGLAYRAANWLCVGQTAGRGKRDSEHQHALPVKDIWLRPLCLSFREKLGGTTAFRDSFRSFCVKS